MGARVESNEFESGFPVLRTSDCRQIEIERLLVNGRVEARRSEAKRRGRYTVVGNSCAVSSTHPENDKSDARAYPAGPSLENVTETEEAIRGDRRWFIPYRIRRI